MTRVSRSRESNSDLPLSKRAVFHRSYRGDIIRHESVRRNDHWGEYLTSLISEFNIGYLSYFSICNELFK